MTTLREAAQQALEALKDDQYRLVEVSPSQYEYKTDLAIAALERALAQHPHPSMQFAWDGQQWLFNGNPIANGEWGVTLRQDGWVIFPQIEEQAEPAQIADRLARHGIVTCPDCRGIGYDASGQTCGCQDNPSF